MCHQKNHMYQCRPHEVTPLRNHRVANTVPHRDHRTPSRTQWRFSQFKILDRFINSGGRHSSRVTENGGSTLFTDEVVNFPLVAQRQDPMSQRIQKKVLAPQMLNTHRAVDVSLVTRSHDPISWRVQTTLLAPQAQLIDETMAIPVVQQRTTSPQFPTIQKI